MALTLMYITNRPEIAKVAETAGVDRIFVDLEHIGKSERQRGMDTVQSLHSLDDVKRISETISTAELLVRINPIHDAFDAVLSTEEEIDIAIANGADILMLPYYKTVEEVRRFLSAVHGRVKTMLLLETPEAVRILDETLCIEGVDYIHIGLNDLSLGYGKKFMFELLTDGTVETLCTKLRCAGVQYGFGGIAALGKGMIPAEMIIREHYRLGSRCAILSRSFCNAEKISSVELMAEIFKKGIRDIREFEKTCSCIGYDEQLSNSIEIAKRIKLICEEMK